MIEELKAYMNRTQDDEVRFFLKILIEELSKTYPDFVYVLIGGRINEIVRKNACFIELADRMIHESIKWAYKLCERRYA